MSKCNKIWPLTLAGEGFDLEKSYSVNIVNKLIN